MEDDMMQVHIKMVLDDRLLHHYRISYEDHVHFIACKNNADHRLIDFLKKRFGLTVEQGYQICDDFMDNDTVVLNVPQSSCH